MLHRAERGPHLPFPDQAKMRRRGLIDENHMRRLDLGSPRIQGPVHRRLSHCREHLADQRLRSTIRPNRPAWHAQRDQTRRALPGFEFKDGV